VLSLLINDEKIKDPRRVVVFNSVFLLIAENLNLYYVGKDDPIYFLRDLFPCIFDGIKIIPTSEAEIENIIFSLKSENSSGYDEMSKILRACESLISRPLSHVYNDSPYTGIFILKKKRVGLWCHHIVCVHVTVYDVCVTHSYNF
jgi:hypothetical protein